MNKIQTLSAVFKNLFFILVFVLPIVDIVLWFFLKHYHHNYFGTVILPHGVRIWTHPSHLAKWLGFGGFLLPTLVDMFMCFMLFKLFKQYQQGHIFKHQSVRYLKWAGWGLLVRQFAGLISQVVVTAALTSGNPVGFRKIALTFSTFDLYGVVVAIMVLVVSWVMAEGCKLQDEVDLTI